MNRKVLMVDDDRLLLNGVSRNLSDTYELSTADGGPEALEILTADPGYAVIMTDMRMPVMDGIKFIGEARRLAPKASYIMLTGNQDLETATGAVNEGEVMRLLTKPCEVEVIRAAIDAGLRKFDLEQVEAELLNKTCAGAIAMLTEVLATARPDVFAKVSQVGGSLDRIRKDVGIADNWQFRMAAKLALVGLACVNESHSKAFAELHPSDPAWRDVHQRVAEISGRLLDRIPRLHTVAAIIAGHPATTGQHCHTDPKTERAVTQTGATLLNVAIHWDLLMMRGLSVKEAAADIKALFPELMTEYVQTFEAMPAPSVDLPECVCELRQLQPNQVLARDLISKDGAVLLRAGTRLSDPRIEKLREYSRIVGPLDAIYVVAAK